MENIDSIIKRMGLPSKEVLEDVKEDMKADKKVIFVGADKYTREGWTDVPNFIIYHKKLSPLGKLVYIGILSYAWGDKNNSFMGQKTLAEKLGMGERTVRKGIAELKLLELLYVQKRGLGLTNRYFLPVKSAKRVSNKYYKEQMVKKDSQDRQNVPIRKA